MNDSGSFKFAIWQDSGYNMSIASVSPYPLV
jgi:hypothetical protein